MGRWAELFLCMAKQSENDGTFVTNEQICKSRAATGESNSRGTPYSEKTNRSGPVAWSKEVRDAYNEGRTSDGDLFQYSYRNKQ